jgi:hypothetical protein
MNIEINQSHERITLQEKVTGRNKKKMEIGQGAQHSCIT